VIGALLTLAGSIGPEELETLWPLYLDGIIVIALG
jgi:hypothetical protein